MSSVSSKSPAGPALERGALGEVQLDRIFMDEPQAAVTAGHAVGDGCADVPS